MIERHCHSNTRLCRLPRTRKLILTSPFFCTFICFSVSSPKSPAFFFRFSGQPDKRLNLFGGTSRFRLELSQILSDDLGRFARFFFKSFFQLRIVRQQFQHLLPAHKLRASRLRIQFIVHAREYQPRGIDGIPHFTAQLRRVRRSGSARATCPTGCAQ